MSIIQPPETGYPDWGRLSQWDGPPLVDITAPPPGAGFLGPFNVSAWWGIGVKYTWNVGAPEVGDLRFQWSQDRAGAKQTGIVDISSYWSDFWENLVIPNQGPWLYVRGQAFGGVPNQYALTVMPTNRYQGVGTFSSVADTVPFLEFPFPANSTQTYLPAAHVTGTTAVSVRSTVTATLDLQVATGAPFVTAIRKYLTASVDYLFPLTLPLDTWQLAATNTTAGAGILTMGLVPKLAGMA